MFHFIVLHWVWILGFMFFFCVGTLTQLLETMFVYLNSMSLSDMEFLEVLTEGLNRVLLVRGGGREVITIYSWVMWLTTAPSFRRDGAWVLMDTIHTIAIVLLPLPSYAKWLCTKYLPLICTITLRKNTLSELIFVFSVSEDLAVKLLFSVAHLVYLHAYDYPASVCLTQIPQQSCLTQVIFHL